MAGPASKRQRVREAGGGAPQLIDAVLLLVLDMVGEVADWLRCRAVCRQWRDVSARARPPRAWATLANRWTKQRHVNLFVERWGGRIEMLDLTHAADLKSKDVKRLLEECSALRQVKVIALTNPVAETLLCKPDLEGVEIMDANRLSIRGSAGVTKNLRMARFWRATDMRNKEIVAMIGPRTRHLGLSDAPLVDDSLLRAIQRVSPPMESLELRSVASLHVTLLGRALQAIAPTLVTLDLSYSMSTRCAFPPVEMPRLCNLMADSTMFYRGVDFCLAHSPCLRLVSLVRSAVDDTLFEGLESGRVLQQLVVIRLSGSKVGESSVRFLQALPSVKIIQVDSCRQVPRDLRLAVRSKYSEDLARLAPALRFANISDQEVQ